MSKLTFVDLFAGIGGIRIAFENAGFKCIFSNDFDEYCKTTYDLNFSGFWKKDKEMFLGDITKISSDFIPKSDILTAGFPCQPFSIAGYRKGFDDNAGRGNLFFDIVRILKDNKPKVFLLENVKNLKTHDKGNTINVIYRELENLGYKVTDKVLNTLEYGNIPQNRERIYIVGFLSQKDFKKFKFPDRIELKQTINNFLEKELYNKLKNDIVKKNIVYQWRRKYVRENKSKACPTLTANMGTGGHNVPIVLDNKGIRKLTPRECANFQGFPNDYILPEITDSHLYKQLGNSVSIPVVERIAKNIKKALS